MRMAINTVLFHCMSHSVRGSLWRIIHRSVRWKVSGWPTSKDLMTIFRRTIGSCPADNLRYSCERPFVPDFMLLFASISVGPTTLAAFNFLFAILCLIGERFPEAAYLDIIRYSDTPEYLTIISEQISPTPEL